MKKYIITVAHMDYNIINHSIGRFLDTNQTLPPSITEWVFVDNCWPIDKDKTSEAINHMVGTLNNYDINATVIKPDKNLGGHGGINYALDYLKEKHSIDYDDLILIYDPDSNPEKSGWLEALIDVMSIDKNFGYVSLTHTAIKDNFSGHTPDKVGTYNVYTTKLDMWNVTMFRAGFLMSEGMLAASKFYGFVETVMHEKCLKEWRKHGYLADYFEIENPVPHPKEYADWKRLHAGKIFEGNFDEYINLHSPKGV
jgi:hypothetical protein